MNGLENKVMERGSKGVLIELNFLIDTRIFLKVEITDLNSELC